MHANTYVIKFDDIEVNDRVTSQERPIHIMEHGTKKLRNKEIPQSKFNGKETSWELETVMSVKFSYLFTDQLTLILGTKSLSGGGEL